MNPSVLIDLHYLPSIAWFGVLFRYDQILLERHEHYIKQSYRNRCHILTAHGVEKLVLPLTAKHGKVVITDVRIDHGQKWLMQHWRTIESAYRKAPYFEHYADDLQKVLTKRQVFLYDLNRDLLGICLGWLKVTKTIRESSGYDPTPAASILDLRNAVHPKKTLNPGVFRPVPYPQVFGKSFVSNLSLIDLIFCEGPGARQLVESSVGGR